jgi:type II secretory pathway component HofQ
VRAEVWGEGYNGPFMPLINMKFDKTPLTDALNQLADEADFTVIVDKKAAEKAGAVVTARLRNTPFDTAVRLLAESADLKMVHRDNALLVTTPEHAAALEKEFARERPSDEEAAGMNLDVRKWRKGPGPSRLAPPMPGVGGM